MCRGDDVRVVFRPSQLTLIKARNALAPSLDTFSTNDMGRDLLNGPYQRTCLVVRQRLPEFLRVVASSVLNSGASRLL